MIVGLLLRAEGAFGTVFGGSAFGGQSALGDFVGKELLGFQMVVHCVDVEGDWVCCVCPFRFFKVGIA